MSCADPIVVPGVPRGRDSTLRGILETIGVRLQGDSLLVASVAPGAARDKGVVPGMHLAHVNFVPEGKQAIAPTTPASHWCHRGQPGAVDEEIAKARVPRQAPAVAQPPLDLCFVWDTGDPVLADWADRTVLVHRAGKVRVIWDITHREFHVYQPHTFCCNIPCGLYEDMDLEEALGRVRAFAARHSDAFRVYECPAGLQVLCTSRVIPFDSGHAMEWALELGGDPGYACYHRDMEYQQRLSPRLLEDRDGAPRPTPFALGNGPPDEVHLGDPIFVGCRDAETQVGVTVCSLVEACRSFMRETPPRMMRALGVNMPKEVMFSALMYLSQRLRANPRVVEAASDLDSTIYHVSGTPGCAVWDLQFSGKTPLGADVPETAATWLDEFFRSFTTRAAVAAVLAVVAVAHRPGAGAAAAPQLPLSPMHELQPQALDFSPASSSAGPPRWPAAGEHADESGAAAVAPLAAERPAAGQGAEAPGEAPEAAVGGQGPEEQHPVGQVAAEVLEEEAAVGLRAEEQTPFERQPEPEEQAAPERQPAPEEQPAPERQPEPEEQAAPERQPAPEEQPAPVRQPQPEIRLAARGKELTEAAYRKIDLSEAIGGAVPLSVPAGGELLLGCARVYRNKVSILLHESEEVLQVHAKHTGKVRVAEVTAAEPHADRLRDLPADVPELKAPDDGMGLRPEDEWQLDGEPRRHDHVEDIDALLGDRGARSGRRSRVGAQAVDMEGWFQAEQSQVDLGLKEQQTAASRTQDALRELADGGRRQLSGSERSSAAAGREARFVGDHELDVGKPVTDDDEAELQRLLIGQQPPKERQGRPTTSSEMVMPPPLPDEEMPPPPQPHSEPRRPKRVKQVQAVDKTQLDKNDIKLNQARTADIVQTEKRWKRFPAWDLAEYAKQDMRQPVYKLLHLDPLAARISGLCGNNVPNLLKPIDPNGEPGDRSFLGQCIADQMYVVATAAGAWQSEPPELEQPPMQDDSAFQQPELPDEFAPLPDVGQLTPQRSAGMKRKYDAVSAADPVESAQTTLDSLRHRGLKSAHGEITFRAMTQGATRRAAAQKFVDLLVLGSKDHVQLAQKKPYADIVVTRGPNFHAVVEAEPQGATQTQGYSMTQGASTYGASQV